MKTDFKLPDELNKPHQIVNEDGRSYYHCGYAIKQCKKCNREFIATNEKQGLYEVCGREACNL